MTHPCYFKTSSSGNNDASGFVVAKEEDEEVVVLGWWAVLMVPMKLLDVIYCFLVKFTNEKALATDGLMDGPTNRWTD